MKLPRNCQTILKDSATGTPVLAFQRRGVEVVLFDTPAEVRGRPPADEVSEFTRRAVGVLAPTRPEDVANLLGLPRLAIAAVLKRLARYRMVEVGPDGRWRLPAGGASVEVSAEATSHLATLTRRLLCVWPRETNGTEDDLLLPIRPRERRRDLAELAAADAAAVDTRRQLFDRVRAIAGQNDLLIPAELADLRPIFGTRADGADPARGREDDYTVYTLGMTAELWGVVFLTAHLDGYWTARTELRAECRRPGRRNRGRKARVKAGRHVAGDEPLFGPVWLDRLCGAGAAARVADRLPSESVYAASLPSPGTSQEGWKHDCVADDLDIFIPAQTKEANPDT